MKQVGSSIIGNLVQVNNFTKEWSEISLHPAIFYRNYDKFITTLEDGNGLYAEIDSGNNIIIRFSDNDDAINFHNDYNDYF